MDYSEHYYKSADGLDLYYREYAGDLEKTPIVCLSGLTRNSGDFHDFACRYSGVRTVYALDYRGRGKSQYDSDYKNYDPQTYLSDVFIFISTLKIEKVIFVGTSLGGLLAMGLAGLAPQNVEAVVLNDIGPEISQSGGDRIASYVGKDVRFASLTDAMQTQKQQFSGAYPDLSDDEWLKTTAVGFILDEEDNSFRPNYDLLLGKALQEQVTDQQQFDLWAFFETLKDKPTLAIRAALSDVLSEDVFDKMKTIHPKMETLILENRGHVPLLSEPLALHKLDQFLEQL